MYYKIKNDILFRQYPGYGYITDNAKFGYRLLNDTRYLPGENYVSEVGAIMLAALSKTPRHIDEITEDLVQIFKGVDCDTLKQDTMDFFQWFVEEGYLSSGETFEACQKRETDIIPGQQEKGLSRAAVRMENRPKEQFSPNELFRYLHIELTSACNEQCVHCYIPHEGKHETIEPALFYRILEEGREMNLVHVTLSGGEPLLHRNFLDFLARCRELALSVNVLSNLTLLTDEIIKEMKRNPLLSVQTSIYSMEPSIHDSITKQKGSFEKTISGLSRLYAAGIPLQISCPVLKQNKDSFMDVVHYGRANHIAVSVEPVIFATYDHSCSNLVNRLSLGEVEEAIEKQLPDGYAEMMRKNAQEWEQLTADDSICSVCRHNVCISPDGKVFPCVGWSTNIIGDLNQQTLQEVWENSEGIQRLRQIKREQFPQCITCEDRGYCKVCMMCNSNENPNGDAFHINDFRCKVAAIIHSKVDAFLYEESSPNGLEALQEGSKAYGKNSN